MRKFVSLLTSLLFIFATLSATAQTKKSKAKAKTSAGQQTEELPPKIEKGPQPTPETPVPAPLTEPEPAPSAPATPEVPKTIPPMNPSESSTKHLFGLSAAVGIPHPARASFDYFHSSRRFSTELGYGSVSATIDGVSATLTNLEAALRWHPWMGSFFLGAIVGARSLTGEKTQLISGQNITAKAEVKSNYLTPYFGWMWGAVSSGFFASMDFGYQAPFSVSATFSTNADALVQATTDYQNLNSDVRDKGRQYGEMGLPVWTLLRIGYLF